MAASSRHDELPVFVHWTDFIEWLLTATKKFPKSARFARTSRIEALALGVLEDIGEAAFLDSTASLVGHLVHANTYEARRSVLVASSMGVAP